MRIGNRLVIGSCGHWWVESYNSDLLETTPRVCTSPGHGGGEYASYGGVVGYSTQHLPLVHVAYVGQVPLAAETEQWPPDSIRLTRERRVLTRLAGLLQFGSGRMTQ